MDNHYTDQNSWIYIRRKNVIIVLGEFFKQVGNSWRNHVTWKPPGDRQMHHIKLLIVSHEIWNGLTGNMCFCNAFINFCTYMHSLSIILNAHRWQCNADTTFLFVLMLIAFDTTYSAYLLEKLIADCIFPTFASSNGLNHLMDGCGCLHLFWY